MLKKLFLVATFVTFASAAHAAAVVSAAGPRVGFSIDPDQILLGGQMVIGDLAPSLTFDPSLELGFGDNLTTIAMNFDLHYHVGLSNSDWRPYFGAGLGVHFYEQDRRGRDDTSTELGGLLMIGAGVPTRSGNRFFTEMKFGLASDVPSLKLVAGWNFRI